MSTWSIQSKSTQHLKHKCNKQQRKLWLLLISGCSLALLYCVVRELMPETSKQGASNSLFDFDFNSVIIWIFHLPSFNHFSRAWPIQRGGGEDVMHQVRVGNDRNITHKDLTLKETEEPMRDLDNVTLQPRRGRLDAHFSELQTWLRHVIPNSKQSRQLRYNRNHNRRLGFVSMSDGVNSGNQSFGDSGGEYNSFDTNQSYGHNGGNERSNYSDLGGGGGIFTRQPPLKQSPPKYGNCSDDDVYNITSPCYGYSSSYGGGGLVTSAAANPQGQATIYPAAPLSPPKTSPISSPAPPSPPTINPLAYPDQPLMSPPSTSPVRTGAGIRSKTQAPSVSPSAIPTVGKRNLLLFDVSVLQSSGMPHNITEHFTGVISDILNANTPFPVFSSNFTMQGQNREQANSSVILVQDPNASVVTLLSSLSSTTSWRQYEVGYRCYYHPSNVPIRNETLLEHVFSICLNAVDASIMSGGFLDQLAAAAKESNVDVLDVAMSGNENNDVAASSGVVPPGSRTYPQSLPTTGLDLRRLIGLAIAVATVSCSTILMLLGAQRERKVKNDELWSFGLATEQDVGKLLNLGFMWQQGEGHEGPPKGVIVFNKQRIGYRDDDSVLMGGFHDPNLLMQTAEVTLPSSGTSQGSERVPNPVLTSLLVTR